MLKVTVIATGKLKERFWKDACAEYAKRLGAYVKIDVREVPDSSPEKEAAAQLALLASLGEAYVVLLDIQGKQLSSEEFASTVESLTVSGASHMVFLVGGSDGVTADIVAKSDMRLSFGRITLPHNLARVVLLEQLYRAEKIIHHEPYHK